MTRRRLDVAIEEWPLIEPFVISRSTDLSAIVVVVRLGEGEARGWGEATPYERYDETPDSVVRAHRSASRRDRKRRGDHGRRPRPPWRRCERARLALWWTWRASATRFPPGGC
ncbi:MAG: hypothetical protein WDM81_17980 [Rhizomicrobium sp.]